MLPPFSRRSSWPSEENALTRAVAHRRAHGLPLLDLTLSNPTHAALPYDEAELLGALAAPGALTYDPEPLGHPVAREAVASYYAARGVAVAPGRVVVTASSSESYGFLFQLLADAGEEVLVPAPSYPLFGFLADLAGVRLRSYPLRYDGAWHVDLPALRACVTPATRAILVVSPNNPTGSYLKRDELAALRAVCAETGAAIVCDEVFADYPLRDDAARVATVAAERDVLTFALSGLSKAAGLPQMKLGWIAIGGPDDVAARATERLAMIADTYLSVATPVQLALPRLLSAGAAIAEQIRARARANLAHLRVAIAAAPAASLLDVEGGWYATLRVPAVRSEDAWALALLDRGVLVHPGHFFDFEREAYLVVSLLVPSDPFREGVARVVAEIGG